MKQYICTNKFFLINPLNYFITMKKITFFSIIIFLLSFSYANATEYAKTSLLSDDFESATAPWGFSTASQLTTSIATVLTPYTGNALQWVFASASGSRTSTKSLNNGSDLTNPSDGIVKLDFKWQLGVPTNKNTSGIFLRFKDSSGNISMAFSTESTQGSTGNAFHYVNLDNTVTNDATASTTRVVPTGGSFVRNSWVVIHASLNFSTHVVDTLIVTDPTGAITYTNYGQSFYSNSATGLATFELYANRDGANMNWTGQIDDFNIYYYKEVSETTDITVKFKDQDDNYFKSDEVITGQVVGNTYNATSDQKGSVTSGGNYYVLDPSSPTSVTVASSGTTLTLLFRRANTATDMVWNGTADLDGNLWSEWNQNFLTGGSIASGYQKDANVTFDATAVNKTVTVNEGIAMGTGNATVSADGYTFDGTGSVSGTGKLYSNPGISGSVLFNIPNNLSEVNVQSGTFKMGSSSTVGSFTVADGTTLNLETGNNFSASISGAGSGVLSIIPTSNVVYSSTISNVSTLSYTLLSAGSVNTSGAFSSMPILNNSFSGAINIATSLSSAMFGSTNNFVNNTLALGDNVAMVYPANPASDGTTNIAIGELAGSSLSKLMGPRLRTVTYNIGGLNTDAQFDGTFENFPADAWSNIPVLNITKTGTGTWTLTGTSSAYSVGTSTVSAGTLVVNGQLGTSTVPVTVAAGATLKGTGTIGGALTVNGTLEGSLTVGSATLAGTTNMRVTGFNTGEFDLLTVTEAVVNGGVLNITIENDPTASGSIKLINAGSYTGDFTAVNIYSTSHPSGAPKAQRAPSVVSGISYVYNATTGILSYTSSTTNVETPHSDLQIYPTLSKGNVYVNATNVNSVNVVSMNGQILRSIKSTNNLTTVNLNGLANGTYILNIKFNDGGNKTQSILLNK